MIGLDDQIERVQNCLIQWPRNIKNSWLHTQEMCCPTTWTKNFDCIFPVFSHRYLYTRLHTDCLYILAKLHILKSLFLQLFASHSPGVYINLWSMFPFVNVVKAGLNRMQVSCSISLYRRYTGWAECHWTDMNILMLFGQSVYENCLAILEVYRLNN